MSAGQFTNLPTALEPCASLHAASGRWSGASCAASGSRRDTLPSDRGGAAEAACTCEACAILFSGQGVKFKRVPRRVRSLPKFNLSDSEWNGLMVPINMAFFFKSSLENRVVALYPSPAGATGSLLALEAWNDIVSRNPILSEMEADVEGLLVNRLGYIARIQRRRVLPAADRRVLQAGRAHSHALERPVRRN